MTFAEFGAVFAQNQAMMGKSRRLKSKSPVKHDLQSRVGQMIFAANDMGNAHQMIINNYRKIIGGHAVGTDNDEIADGCAFKLHRSAD